MNKNELTPQESLQVINEMIDTSKTRMRENGFIYLFWGWLMIFCALAQFVLLQFEYYEISYYPYFLGIPGGIYTGFYYSRKEKKEQGTTYVEKILSMLWIAVGINIFIAAFIFSFTLQINPIPFILMFLGIGTVVSGQSLKFKPLIAGGLICNLMAVLTIFLPFIYHPVLIVLALIAADLIPGYSLKNKYKKTYA
ncbi:MAG: hypothetical protein ACLFUW_01240 [Bacteroidales bacterium]